MHDVKAAPIVQKAAFPVLLALSLCHFLNDMIQSLLPAIYPIIKEAYKLDFGQIGLITMTFQLTASLFQPLVGAYTDRKPMPYSMVLGMGFTLAGLIGLAWAGTYPMLLASAACVGVGSSIFHPEATRMARNASGGQQGMAQGIFQLGGQMGNSIGPLLAAFVVVPRGQGTLAWFSIAALAAMALMTWMVTRYLALRREQAALQKASGVAAAPVASPYSRRTIIVSMTILIVLLFSKSAYSSSFSSFYTFYLIEKFKLSVQASQYMLFLFLVSSALGAVVGGMVGDRIGRDRIIWFSIVGALPFTIALPYADLTTTAILTVIINLIMSSAFASIMIYAMDLMPNRVGFIGGMFYGLSFGLGGLAAAILGELADRMGIETVYALCSFLPLLGLLAWFLPKQRRPAGM